MKKYGFVVGLLLCAWFAHAVPLPDNMYMRAMQDEIKRSMKKLRRPGVEKPYFIAYKLEQINSGAGAQASFGALYDEEVRDSQLNAYVWVDIGNAQKDSLGYANDAYYAQHAYRPRFGNDLPKSYEGIRQILWRLTDKAYTFAAETYQQKQAYERTKQTEKKDKVPDVIPAKQATYVEEIPPLPTYDVAQLQTFVKQQSAKGKDLPFLEQFSVRIDPIQKVTYYLNSRGGFYQMAQFALRVKWFVVYRDKDGFKRTYNSNVWLADFSPEQQAWVETSTDSLLHNLSLIYEATKGENYVGPVLLMPQPASRFIYEQLVQNFQNVHPLASAGYEADPQKGRFDSEGQRIMSPGITVWDAPYLRVEGGIPLSGFMPVDDEGVESQPLTLVENGRVVEIPRTTRPLPDKKISNGHARITHHSMPRERLTNVIVDVEEFLSEEELIQKLLDRCEELGLEYGYIVYEWLNSAAEPIVVKVYLDGQQEVIHGLQIESMSTRSLRDILAAGYSYEIIHIEDPAGEEIIPTQTVNTPALLLEELELVVTEGKPDKKPFVPKP